MGYELISFEPGGTQQIDALRQALEQRFQDRGLDADLLNFRHEPKAGGHDPYAVSAAVYFGGDVAAGTDTRDALKALLGTGITVIPVVDDRLRYSQLVPGELHPINGFIFSDPQNGYEALASRLLEIMRLLREARRLFISYRQQEARDVAIQLYEALDERAFDVFLDTVSIRTGEEFQRVLHHRLADVDVILLLNTPGFMASRWTVEELTLANMLNVAILRLDWPEEPPPPGETEDEKRQRTAKRNRADDTAAFCKPFPLTPADFTGSRLTDATCARVIESVEALRAAALAAREAKLVQQLAADAQDAGFELLPQPERFIILRRDKKKDIAVMPVVGAPTAESYQAFFDLVARQDPSPGSPFYLLYDHRCLLKRHLAHLGFLNTQMTGVKTLRIDEARDFLAEEAKK